ncbi:MAG: M20/M25/M40 family metallo-hydrolase, partial [Candidatus Syntrophosphaera sp.]
MDIDIKSIINLRHRLHAAPELSGKETATAELIAQTLQKSHPQRIITGVGGNGVIAVFKSPEAGPVICFRADIDALPIAETGEGGHISRIPGRSHACGHDGHSAILLGFAQWLNAHPEKWSGSVILLFQPAEET